MKNSLLLGLILLLTACTSLTEEQFLAIVASDDTAAVEASIDKLSGDDKNEILSSALFAACSKGNSAMANLLLDNGAIPYPHILMEASKARMNEVALRIAQFDDEIGDYVDDYNGANPLQYALAYGLPEVAKILLDSPDQAFTTSNGAFNPPIHIAAEQGYTDIVEIILEKKPTDVNLRLTNNMTPVFYAIQKGHKEVVQVLVNAGADLTITATWADYDYTPLTFAQSSYTEAGDEIVALLSTE